MMLGVDIAEMGWDVSLRAQSRRALSMNGIWLREKGEGKWVVSRMDNRFLGLSSRNGDMKERRGKSIDPILGFNIEGGVSSIEQQKDKFWSNQMQMAMEHDLEDETLIGEEGKNFFLKDTLM
ncbi:hypothetical protein Gotri_027122 [Gossypium trilobum]|uniref:Uncharacterized protein n=1 Tax=Gossypium trilobum TaxID=34281 RepID=A0A7J9FPJ8_9ROSI|nr:hypothetical protein [Gossypium trilobum]